MSLRLAQDDVQSIREIAERFGTSESEIMRFAVKSVLSLLSPLRDHNAVGRDVLPILLELGGELCRHFEWDEQRLDAIVNGPSKDESGSTRSIDKEDLRLLMLISSRWGDAALRFLSGHLSPDVRTALSDGSSSRIREHLYAKYVAIEAQSEPQQAA